MSTQTAALPDGTKLTKPASGEKVSLSVINTNTDNIANNINRLNGEIAISNQYSTVLAAINAFRNNRQFPFSIQKSGNSSYTDLPSGLNNTCEWSVICYGNAQRMTAELTVFTGGSSQNKFKYTANLYDGDYLYGWSTLDDKVFLTGMAQTISSATDFNTLLDIKNFVISSNNVAVASANCPSSNAGKLCTWSIDGGSFDRTWAYGGQIYIDIPGREFRRQVTTNGNKTLNFGSWIQMGTENFDVKWKYAERTGITQSSGGSDYWTISGTAFPPLTGYSRRVVGISVSNRYIIATGGYDIGTDNKVTIYVYNTSNSSQTYDIAAIFLYLPDSRKLT